MKVFFPPTKKSTSAKNFTKKSLSDTAPWLIHFFVLINNICIFFYPPKEKDIGLDLDVLLKNLNYLLYKAYICVFFCWILPFFADLNSKPQTIWVSRKCLMLFFIFKKIPISYLTSFKYKNLGQLCFNRTNKYLICWTQKSPKVKQKCFCGFVLDLAAKSHHLYSASQQCSPLLPNKDITLTITLGDLKSYNFFLLLRLKCH